MGKNKGAAAEPQGQAKQDKKGKQKQERQPQQRFERKEGGLTHYSSFLQVLPMDIEHTSPAVLLFFDKERYLFNAGEGIQRLFREHRLKIRQVNAYFITRVSTETMSGLAGMALSVTPGDAAGLLGKQVSANIKGPRGLAGYVAAFRTYVNKENTVAVEEFDSNTTEPLLKSDVVSITPFLVHSAVSSGSAAAAEAEAEAAKGSPAKGSRAERGHSPAAKRRRVAPDNSPEMSDAEEDAKAAAEGRERPADLSPPATAVYLVRLSGRPGKFLPDKARQLGVKPGPLFGELQRGHSVTLEDGRVVTGADVCEPPVPGPAVMVVDTPDAASLAAVAAHPRLLSAAAEATAETDGAGRLCLVVHLLPAALAADGAALAAWRGALGPAWRHVVVSSGQHQPSAIPRATVFQAQLHAVHPTAFPLFALDNAAAPPQLPEGAAAASPAAAATPAAAAAAAAAAAGAAAAAASGDGKGGAGGKKAGAAAAAAVAAVLAPQGQAPVLPLPESGVVEGALSALRVNLVPPARQGLEYGDVFRYDPPAATLELMRTNPDFAPVMAAAAAAQRASGMQVEVPTAPTPAAADGAKAEGAAGAGDVEMAERGPASAAAADMDPPSTVASGDRRQAELTFLGTASSQPSKFRNVSGCYVDLFERGGLLVDCGEDAMGQLARRYGGAGAAARLEELALVWVSHMHADHHGGLYRLLEWRARRGCPPLLVVGPQRLFEVLVKYSSVVPIQFTFVPNLALSNASADRQLPPAVQRVLESTLARLGLAGTAPAAGDDGAAGGKAKEQQEQQEGEGQGWRRLPPRGFRPFYVHHIHDAHGLRLEGEAGWSIVFSGDTRPCNETIAAARGATLLVHEATFEESMVGEAKAKKHSTTAEAVSVGERAGAYRIILTHFSTRYPTLPELDLAPHPRVSVAMDLQVVNLADLPWQPALVRPLGLLFKQLEAEKLKDDDDDE